MATTHLKKPYSSLYSLLDNEKTRYVQKYINKYLYYQSPLIVSEIARPRKKHLSQLHGMPPSRLNNNKRSEKPDHNINYKKAKFYEVEEKQVDEIIREYEAKIAKLETFTDSIYETCTLFELDEEAFSGYFSNEELADLSEDDIATVITERDITKMCDQLDHSMGSYMDYFQILCILLSAVLIYLLTKLIIEKNENAISMTKILGYENKEIASLYLLSTTIMVVIEDAVSVVLGAFVMNLAWKAILFSYSGWFAFVIQPAGYVKMFAFVLIGYLFVMILDFMRIKKIPMDQALKNVE